MLGSHLVAALAYDGVDPLGEGSPDDRVEHIYQPLSGQTVPVHFIGQVVEHSWMILQLGEDLFDAQPFVLGCEQVGDLGALDVWWPSQQ